MSDKALFDALLNAVDLVDVSADLVRAVREAGLEFVQHIGVGVRYQTSLRSLNGLQMFDSHFKNVSLFEFGVTSGLKKNKN